MYFFVDILSLFVPNGFKKLTFSKSNLIYDY